MPCFVLSCNFAHHSALHHHKLYQIFPFRSSSPFHLTFFRNRKKPFFHLFRKEKLSSLNRKPNQSVAEKINHCLLIFKFNSLEKEITQLTEIPLKRSSRTTVLNKSIDFSFLYSLGNALGSCKESVLKQRQVV